MASVCSMDFVRGTVCIRLCLVVSVYVTVCLHSPVSGGLRWWSVCLCGSVWVCSGLAVDNFHLSGCGQKGLSGPARVSADSAHRTVCPVVCQFNATYLIVIIWTLVPVICSGGRDFLPDGSQPCTIHLVVCFTNSVTDCLTRYPDG